MSGRVGLLLCSLGGLALLLVLSSCANHNGKPKSGVSAGDETDGGSANQCVDDDGDGFGRYCKRGLDCDDSDPTVTDECRRCVVPNENCPCEPQQSIMCKPPNMAGDGGVYMCMEGSRYCRDGFWTKCEAAGDYVFVAKQ